MKITFSKNSSTVFVRCVPVKHSYSNVWNVVDDLGRQITQGHQVDLVLLDFSKAFDKVNHLKLLFKLSIHCVKLEP